MRVSIEGRGEGTVTASTAETVTVRFDNGVSCVFVTGETTAVVERARTVTPWMQTANVDEWVCYADNRKLSVVGRIDSSGWIVYAGDTSTNGRETGQASFAEVSKALKALNVEPPGVYSAS